MDLSPEPKPTSERKSSEECLENLITNVPTNNKNDKMPGFSHDNNNLEKRENKMNEGKLYSGMVSNSIEHFDCKGQEKRNGVNATKKLENGNRNDDEIEYFEDGLKLHAYEKEALKEDKENVEMETDFLQQINLQNDVSRSSSNTSSENSSGIENDFKLHDSIFDDSSTKQFPNVEGYNLAKYSCKKENEVSKKSGVGENEQEKINLINIKDNISTEDKCVVSSHNDISLFDAIKFPYKNPSNAFDVVVPLIGKTLISVDDIKPFNNRYDLAAEINQLKGIQDAPFMPKLSYHEWRKQRDARSQKEKDREERYEKFVAVKTAAYIIQISVSILQEMQNDNPDEEIIQRCFLRFLSAPASTLSLILSSQFVHVMMYIRGSSDFSHKLRRTADQCYMKCHVMFPIPDGYNFETVYTSEVVKNLPDQLNGMRNFILDYGDFEFPASESDDSAFSDNNGD
ncbi:hypothetical protein HNY73_020703 [Argiope bruennichi]|uniref:Uncharacterized protein n=1 Tax=Argiope bruennichi TaxID=94029 RepID=A0A8T0EAC0_ARGBR|nr:hypothetical protein HNY73_020703 [Argiope bruennichi]